MSNTQPGSDNLYDWIGPHPPLNDLRREIVRLRQMATEKAEMGLDVPAYGIGGLIERLDRIEALLRASFPSDAHMEGMAGYVPDPGERYMGDGASADESTFWLLCYGYDPVEDDYHVVDIRGYLDDRKITAGELLMHAYHYTDWEARMAETCAANHEAHIRSDAG